MESKEQRIKQLNDKITLCLFNLNLAAKKYYNVTSIGNWIKQLTNLLIEKNKHQQKQGYQV